MRDSGLFQQFWVSRRKQAAEAAQTHHACVCQRDTRKMLWENGSRKTQNKMLETKADANVLGLAMRAQAAGALEPQPTQTICARA
jgi:hypothetical protein